MKDIIDELIKALRREDFIFRKEYNVKGIF
jgi:hypothetical protein